MSMRLSKHIKFFNNNQDAVNDYNRIPNFLAKDRKFPSGARRDDNSNKPFIHNFLGYTRQRFGYLMTKGAKKYGDKNWLLGMPTYSYLESVDRHLAAFMEGDNKEDHLAAILFGIQGCMINQKEKGIESDYYFKLK